MSDAIRCRRILFGALIGGAIVVGGCAQVGGGLGDPDAGAGRTGGAGGTGGAVALAGTGGAGGTSTGAGTGGASTSTGSGGAQASGGTTNAGTGGVASGGGTTSTGGRASGTGGTTSAATGGRGPTGTGGGASPATGGAGGGVTRVDLKGKKVLFIVDDPASLSEGDSMLRDIFAVSRDMIVTLGDTTSVHADAAAMNLIVASSGASASEFPALYKSAAVPMLVFGNGAYQALGFIAASAGKGTVSTPVMLSIVDAATPLAAALPLTPSFSAIGTTRNTSVYWGTPGGSPIKVAAVTSAPAQLIVFAFEKGAAMAVGTASGRRVALGFRTDVIGDLSIESFKLLNAAIEWTATAPP